MIVLLCLASFFIIFTIKRKLLKDETWMIMRACFCLFLCVCVCVCVRACLVCRVGGVGVRGRREPTKIHTLVYSLKTTTT